MWAYVAPDAWEGEWVRDHDLVKSGYWQRERDPRLLASWAGRASEARSSLHLMKASLENR